MNEAGIEFTKFLKKNLIVRDPQMKIPFKFNQVNSMMPFYQNTWVFYVKCRERERERETESKGLEEREKPCWLKTEMVWVKMAVSEIKHLSIFRDVNQ